MVDATEAWAVGHGSEVVRIKDQQSGLPAALPKIPFSPPKGVAFVDVWASSGSDVWMIYGPGRVLHWNGT